MPRVYLGVGSNIERERHIVAGLDALQRLFGQLALSSVYDSEAIGFEGQPFLNLAVGVDTRIAVAELARQLRHIEFEHGRPVNASRFSARQLDIDILTYGDAVGTIDGVELPRAEILENAFVLGPLAEIAPQHQHPTVQRNFGQLWRDYDHASQALVKIDFEWRGRLISRAGSALPAGAAGRPHAV